MFGEDRKEVALETLDETAGLVDVTFSGNFMMAVPLMFFASTKWKGRGKAIFDSKTDDLDALDEVISQWLDAVRAGRVKRYIPEDLIPKSVNGELLQPNPFDNQFVNRIYYGRERDTENSVSQPQIAFEAYQASYASFLDLTLQGIISP